MDRKAAAAEVKRRYAEYLQPAKKKNTYVCPLCGNGTGSTGDGMTVDPHGDGTHLKCWKCGFYGDLPDLYQQEHKCDVGTAFNALYERFGIKIDAPTAVKSTERKANEERPIETQKTPPQGDTEPDFTEYYKECRAHITDPAAQQYLSFRGLTQETADRFNLGYDPKTGFLIIPAAKSFYVARNTDPAAQFRYKNPTGAAIALFNEKALYNDGGRPVFIVEGAIDALSVIETGREAVALNSTSNVRKLLKTLEKQPTRNPLILCLDSDEAGRKATETLKDGLKDLNVTAITAEISGTYKDPNEALTKNKTCFIGDIEAAERDVCNPDNTTDYIYRGMMAEIKDIEAQAHRKTGFANLDAAAGSVYTGLYLIGAISSLGKTTFAVQLADQMAEQGQHVLYFSMEQSRLEIVTKSISRTMAKADKRTAATSLQIRQGLMNEKVAEATMNYCDLVSNRVSVIEGNFGCTVSYIKDYALQYKERNNGVNPIVIVDYLQILQAEVDPETGRKPTDAKTIVDYNVTQLKRLTRKGITVFVISSLNRSNYLAPIDFEALKESGGLEYTADVIWGLQLEAIHEDVFDKEGNIKKKRERIKAAKREIPRKVELVCLKNRYGISGYEAHFNYFPQFDYYEPSDGFTDYKGSTPWGKPSKSL